MPLISLEKIIWLALSFTAGLAYSYIPATLHQIRDLTVVPDTADNGPNKQLQKDAEKAIPLSTLRALSDGSSHEIRAATIKIVANRAVNSRVKNLLLADLWGTEEQRGNAICALELLLTNKAIVEKNIVTQFLDFKSFHAVVGALHNLLAQHPPLWSGPVSISSPIPPSPIRPAFRPLHEERLMKILKCLLDTTRPVEMQHQYSSNIECALKAGLVTRWLKHYPFPCSLQENGLFNFNRSDVCNLLEFKVWGSDDKPMADIMKIIANNPLGKKQLREVGLRASSYVENLNSGQDWSRTMFSDIDADVRMINGESTAGATTPPELRELLDSVDEMDHSDQERPYQRSNAMTSEEDSLRRSRREAIVIAEPGTPLRRENILQRQDNRLTGRANDQPTIHELLEEFTAATVEGHGPTIQRIDSRTLDRQMARLEAITQRFEAEGITAEMDFSARADDVPEIASLRPDDATRIRQEEEEGEAMVNALLRSTEERRNAAARRMERGQGPSRQDGSY